MLACKDDEYIAFRFSKISLRYNKTSLRENSVSCFYVSYLLRFILVTFHTCVFATLQYVQLFSVSSKSMELLELKLDSEIFF